MSGAEGIAGLAIGAVGLTALFTTCIDTFNIVITARDFDHAYEVLCADLALQRLRFCLWGEAVGLVSRDSLQTQVRLPELDSPQIKTTLTQTLQAIQSLLERTDRTRDRFSLRPRSSRGLGLFRGTFNQFGLRTYRERRKTSVAAVTKWAVHSGEKFRERIDRLKSLIDGLERVSEALGVLEIQRSRMRTEIESLDDIESLRLIEEASLQSHRDLSDIASGRLVTVETSSAMDRASEPHTSQSFYTAEEGQQMTRDQTCFSSLEGQGANFESSVGSSIPQNSRIIANLVDNGARSRNWKTGPKTDTYGAKLQAFDLDDMAIFGKFPASLLYLRNRLLELDGNDNLWDRKPLNPRCGKSEVWSEYSKIGSKRIVRDLRICQDPRVQWLACSPLDFRLNHLLAGIEGPPDTPYEGGVFWIELRMSKNHPFKPPNCRFLTRIYHPNIDSRGQICLDIQADQWSAAFRIDHILASICSVLDDPGLTDPLVPEIAEIYCKDYGQYYRNAKAYTSRYAFAEPPEEQIKIFPGETQQSFDSFVHQGTAVHDN